MNMVLSITEVDNSRQVFPPSYIDNQNTFLKENNEGHTVNGYYRPLGSGH